MKCKNSTSEQLDLAWNARFEGDVAKVHSHLSEVQTLLLPDSEMDFQSSYEKSLRNPAGTVSDLNLWVALQSWLLRMQGAMNEAEEMIEFACRKSASLGRLPDFHLEFQRATLAHRKADYSQALAHYQTAKGVAKNPQHQAIVLGNSLYVLEALGLPFESTRLELLKILNDPSAQVSSLRTVHEQFEVFQIRQWYWKGDFKSIFEQGRSSEFNQLSDQPFWHRLQLSQMPYHGYHQASLDSAQLIHSQHATPEINFSGRTLLGISIKEETKLLRVHLLADRIYLWTWRWLVTSEPVQFQRLRKTIQLLLDLSEGFSLSSEDYYQVHLSLRWIKLFTDQVQTEIDSLILFYKPYPLLSAPGYEYESKVIDLLEAKKSGKKDLLETLTHEFEAHPFSKTKEHHFCDLVNGVQPGNVRNPSWMGFLAHAAQLTPKPMGSGSDVIIETDRNRIRYWVGEMEIQTISASLSQAICLLNQNSVVPCADFCAKVFGFKKYDSDLHLPRIFNLLARLRKILPSDLKVGVKEGCIFSAGSWTKIEIQDSKKAFPLIPTANLSTPASVLRKIKKIAYQDHDLVKQVAASLMIEKPEFKRQDLEKILELSRASVNRLLDHWEKKGLVKKLGYSRNIRYRFLKEAHA